MAGHRKVIPFSGNRYPPECDLDPEGMAGILPLLQSILRSDRWPDGSTVNLRDRSNVGRVLADTRQRWIDRFPTMVLGFLRFTAAHPDEDESESFVDSLVADGSLTRDEADLLDPEDQAKVITARFMAQLEP